MGRAERLMKRGIKMYGPGQEITERGENRDKKARIRKDKMNRNAKIVIK